MKLKLCFQKCKEYKKFCDLMIVFQKMHLVCVSMVLARFYIVNMHFIQSFKVKRLFLWDISKHKKGDP
jgi:hypothetical protein